VEVLPMKIVSDKNLLLDAITTVQKSVSTKSTMPVLEGILINAKKNTLHLTGNNLEICINYEIPVNIIQEGIIVVNSKMFGDIIRKLPNEPICIEYINEKEIIIDCGNKHFKINTINPKGFPDTPEVEHDIDFEIKQKYLKEMIRKTIFAISVDEKNRILTGSLFEYKNNQLTVVSIDGYRMAISRYNMDIPTVEINETSADNVGEQIKSNQSEFSIVIPGKTLNEISKILSSTDDTVKIYCSENQVVFETVNCKITSRLLSGEYLNYVNFIPEEYKTEVKIKKDDFLSSLERASIIAIDNRKYPVKINIDSDGMILSSNTEFGTVKEELYPEIDGDEISISYNPKYFVEALKVVEDEYINLKLTTTVGPSIISPIDGNEYTFMILPVRQ
jgi:DNA polymerase-3 subunit beta